MYDVLAMNGSILTANVSVLHLQLLLAELG